MNMCIHKCIASGIPFPLAFLYVFINIYALIFCKITHCGQLTYGELPGNFSSLVKGCWLHFSLPYPPGLLAEFRFFFLIKVNCSIFISLNLFLSTSSPPLSGKRTQCIFDCTSSFRGAAI
ncbi:hypothetical protein XELAEV_18006613mg [Xenopus laevis]|uniref:Uncharacterized protein n=1 Tax=Xenopus laevis TaxID=8355 RepID=A0A974I4A8_XENLA|nr:hypothetical protein XELAEV_18006613mg [Xenopus laevis]